MERQMTLMTLRDEMAMAAMQGDWAAQRPEWHEFHVNEKPKFAMSAQMYYQMADAMLKARESSSAESATRT